MKSKAPVWALLFSSTITWAFSQISKGLDGSCSAAEKSRTEISFVVDRTDTFDEFFDNMVKIADKITSAISKIHPNSRFGLSVFADFKGCHDNIDCARKGTHPKDQTCYFPVLPLTTDTKKFKKAISKSYPFRSGKSESSLTALLFTAVDSYMAWTPSTHSHDPDGVRVHKILILITDAEDSGKLPPKEAKKRSPAKGDGTDTCKKSLPPTFEVINRALSSRSMSVIGLYPKENRPYDIYERYEGYFRQMPDIPYVRYKFSKKKVEEIVEHILSGVNNSTAAACMTSDPLGYNTLGF